jgi:glutamyl-tRNA reductase
VGFYLIGIDYQSANLIKREEANARRRQISACWGEASTETAGLSTCNRFELYGITNALVKLPPIEAGWYLIEGKAAVFAHALRVAVGLESQLKGELQILEQVNSWYNKIPAGLAGIWHRAYSDAILIRRESGLNGQDNIATLILEDMKKNLAGGNELKIAVAGTGKIAGLLAKHRPLNARLIFAAHKNKLSADNLAQSANGKSVFLNELTGVLAEADFLVSATASPHFILKAEGLKAIAALRKQPLYIYDLAIPRDIEPAASGIKGIILKNLDDLSFVFKEHNDRIKNKLSLAEYLVVEKVKEYERNLKHGCPAKPVIFKAGR